ncbi:hypothetical protein [Micromonospora sp. RV43]|uniref:hypothetical protein n=1 Tax=Micromonospora sp. RV43 TaxID=1661387 RepID=UPI00064C01FA|nr:hypothetical protein [Micromonospora sp. RV43]
MPWDSHHGCATPGSTGRANHLGDPLTVQQIRELPDGAEVVITWDGGNGPHPYRVLVDVEGVRRVEVPDCGSILQPWLCDEGVPFHRVTLGWDDATRVWHDGKVPEPEHIQERWRRLRSDAKPVTGTRT